MSDSLAADCTLKLGRREAELRVEVDRLQSLLRDLIEKAERVQEATNFWSKTQGDTIEEAAELLGLMRCVSELSEAVAKAREGINV